MPEVVDVDIAQAMVGALCQQPCMISAAPLAGGFFDGTTDASERHAFMVQLLEETSCSERQSALVASGQQVCFRRSS